MKWKQHRRGPFVAAAAFCVSVTEDQYGHISLHRILQIADAYDPASAPTAAPQLVIVVVRGDGAETFRLRLEYENVDGGVRSLPEQAYAFHDRAVQNVNIQWQPKLTEGFHFVRVFLDGAHVATAVLEARRKSASSLRPRAH